MPKFAPYHSPLAYLARKFQFIKRLRSWYFKHNKLDSDLKCARDWGEGSLSSYFLGGLNPLLAVGEDFVNTLRSYKTKNDVLKDLIQPLRGIGNIIRGLFNIVITPVIFVVNIFRYAYIGIKSRKKRFAKNMLLDSIKASGGLLDGVTSIFRGATQIATTALTWFIRMPLRGIISGVRAVIKRKKSAPETVEPDATVEDVTLNHDSTEPTLYEVLGVSSTASSDEIRTVYHKKALTTHPDKGGSKKQFLKLQAAYEVLSDPRKRKEYDDYLSGGREYETKEPKELRKSLYRFYELPLSTTVDELNDIIIPHYRNLLKTETDSFQILSHYSFLANVESIVFAKFVQGTLNNMQSNKDKSDEKINQLQKKLLAVIKRYRQKVALLTRSDTLALQDYIMNLLQRQPEYQSYKDIITMRPFSEAWPLKIHLLAKDYAMNGDKRTRAAQSFVKTTLRNATNIQSFLKIVDTEPVTSGLLPGVNEIEEANGRVNLVVHPTYFMQGANQNAAIEGGNTSSDTKPSDGDDITITTTWKNNLHDYLRTRSQGPKYTGWRVGYNREEKAEAAQLAIDILSDRAPPTFFCNRLHKTHHRALQQGELGKIAKDAVQYIRRLNQSSY